MHFELDRRLTPEELADLEDAARHVLATVRAVVDDWEPLRGKLDRLADIVAAGAERVRDEEDGEPEELLAFLRWTGDHHFVFLGFHEDAADSEGRLRGVDGSGLGLLRDAREAGELRVPAHDPPVAGTDGATVLEITKTHTLSPVHRREPMNVLIARRFDAAGAVVDEARLLGLFTTRAYAEPASITPLLRDKLRRILEAEDLIDGSHDSKAAITLFDGFPKGELFGAPIEDLRAQIAALLSLRADEVRLLGRRSRDGRGAALVAALPRERYSATLRERLRGMVASAYGTDVVEQHEVFGEDDRVYLHLTVRSGGGLPEVDVSELERRLILEARTWRDRVGAALIHSHGPERGRMLAARWLKRLPESYRAAVEPLIAAHDVERFEALATGRADFLVGLQDERGPDGRRRTRVAFYRRGPKIELSQATPMLEHLGLRVIEEVPARLHGDDELWLQAFGVLGERRRAAVAARGRRPRRRVAGGRLARRDRVRLAQPPGRRRRAALAAGAGAARLPPLPPADRLALHRGLPERRDRRQPGDHRQADPALRAALRDRRAAAATTPPRRRCARRSGPTSTASSCSTTTGSFATNSG